MGNDIQGLVENELLQHGSQHPKSFETYIMRPGLVLAKEANLRDFFRQMGPSVKVDRLAIMMVRTALDGSEKQILENTDISA